MNVVVTAEPHNAGVYGSSRHTELLEPANDRFLQRNRAAHVGFVEINKKQFYWSNHHDSAFLRAAR